MQLRAWLTHARCTCLPKQACALVDWLVHEVVVVVVVLVYVMVVVWQESSALLAFTID